MKKEILKIAGVKSEKEFYKKFPDEASFMKAHGKEFKKAMRANKVDKAQFGNVAPSGTIDESTIDRPQAPVDYSYLFEAPGAKQAARAAERDAAILGRSTGGQNFDVKNPTGQDLQKMISTEGDGGGLGDLSSYVQAGQDILRGASMIKGQKKKVRQAKQMANLTGVQAAAAASTPIQPIKRQYIRPEDTVIQPDQLFTSRGVGTNVLAEDGAVINQIGGNPTEIMNTFAPNTIYSDMGYEPLSDSDQVKQFAGGGQLFGMMNDSKFGDIMSGGGGDVLTKVSSAITGEEDAGTAIGGGIGQAAGSLFLGPVGGMVGKFAGKLIGDLVDQSERKIRKAQKQTKKNMASIMGSQFGAGIQNQFSANVRDGGYIPKAQKGKEKEKDLTKKDGECKAEVARDKEYSELSKASAIADKAGEIAAKQEAKQIATTHRADYADYINESLTGYGDKIKKKDFETAYQAFAAQNPELAKDRLLYTVASKELPKLRSEAYSLRSKLSRIDPSLDYKSLTLPQLMQTMQKGFGGSEGYLRAWNEGFPERLYTMPQLTPIQQQENGGQTSEYEWISHTWQPQVITHFGEHKVSDLLRPPADADMLRAGGEIKNLRKNYMSPEEEMLTNMAFGGQLKTTWGGHAEPISQNPYLPGTGQTVMFRGQSHDESDGKGRTGIGVKYGNHDSYTDYAEYGTEADADVEVERNEPAVELPNGDGDNSMVVYGNLKIPNQFLHEIGDPKAKGKKFKSYVKDLSKKEQKQNKIIDKSSEQLDDLNPISPFDRLKFNSLAANIEGANMKLKEYAEFKQNAAAVQNAINDTAEEMGLDADSLAKGKVMQAKKGANIPKAQDGKKLTKVEALPSVPKGQKKGQVFWGKVTQQDFEDMKARNPWYDWENFNPASRADVLDFQIAFNREAKKIGADVRLREDGAFGEQTASAKALYDGVEPRGRMQRIDLGKAYKGIPELKPVVPKTTGPATNILKPVTLPKKDLDITSVLSQALPYLRPSDVEELDPNQLLGEMYALSTNQVEPVWAEKLTPRLSTPIDISLQDILNENRATLRRQQQILGYNPAAQAGLAAGEYALNQRILGEQFRMNQAEKQRVYDKNRDILGQYDIANLKALDEQYVRQNEALSKTKATTQEALNSIASKIAQNRLENRTLATYENLYNYRYDPNFRALSYQLADFNIPTVGSTQKSDIPSTATPPISGKAKSGSSVKKRKEALNSTVVRSLKNL